MAAGYDLRGLSAVTNVQIASRQSSSPQCAAIHLFASAPGALEPDEQHHVAAKTQGIGRRSSEGRITRMGCAANGTGIQWPGYPTPGTKAAHKMPELAPALSVIWGWGGGGCMS